MIKEELESWDNLADLVKSQFKNGWIFRGVRSSEYELIPSIGRLGARKDPNSYSVEAEQRVLDQFTREARAKFGWQPQSRLEWMILGQHHRLPTRLLDWSESLLVAAYFAVDGPPEKDAAIYGVEAPEEIDDLKKVDPFRPPLRVPSLGATASHQPPDNSTKRGAYPPPTTGPSLDKLCNSSLENPRRQKIHVKRHTRFLRTACRFVVPGQC